MAIWKYIQDIVHRLYENGSPEAPLSNKVIAEILWVQIINLKKIDLRPKNGTPEVKKLLNKTIDSGAEF